MQTAVMDKLQQQVLSNIEKISVVNWQTCLLYPSERAENTEMHFASHLGLGVNPAALWAVADRLAQPEGSSGHLTGRARLPLHMPRRAIQYRPDKKRQ
jgi:hypothetical protein